MEERDLNPFLDAIGEQEATAQEQQEEERSVASSLFAKIRAALAGASGAESAEPSDAGAPADSDTEGEDLSGLEGLSGGESESQAEQTEQEPSAPSFPQPTDEEIQQAAKAVTQAIREASNLFGVELSDDKVLTYALAVLGQAYSLEQAELLAYGLLAREAQRQGVGVRANRTREFEHGKRDTLEEFIEMVSR
jgi:hypothetical protein